MIASGRTAWIAGIIVVFTTTLAVLSSAGDVPIVDEVPHIGSGYSYVQTLQYRLNPEHPPLVKDLAGLSISHLTFDPAVFTIKPWTTDVNGQWEFGRALIFHSGVDPDTVKTWARLPVLIFYLIACWLVWRWSQERSGAGAALLAVVLVAFSPTIIAHARLVTTDMAAATGVLAATYCFLRYLRAPTRKNFWIAGVVLGLALLCKFSTALLGPYFVLVAILWGLEGQLTSERHWRAALQWFLRTVLVGIVSLAVVWAVYLVQTAHYSPQEQLKQTYGIIHGGGHGIIEHFTLWAADKPVLRSLGQWTLGLGMVEGRAAGGNTIYWMGQVVNSGGFWYFPLVYLLKEPIAWWLLVALALSSVLVHRHRHRRQHATKSWWRLNADTWIMGLWLIIYWAVSLHSSLNIGVRHLLPVYPFTIILVAGAITTAVDWLHQHDHPRWRWYLGVVAVLVGWYVFESVHVFPSYLSYFNQVAGGPSGGYRYVVDSNLDWGQDLKRLSAWVKDNNIKHLSLDYFGWSDPVSYLGDRYIWTTSSWKSKADFLAHNQSNGWIAISVTYFQNANGIKVDPNAGQGDYRWLIDEKPVAVIGHSIFVWHITK